MSEKIRGHRACLEDIVQNISKMGVFLLIFRGEPGASLFHRFAVRSSSAHEGKIIIFERFQCSLTKTIQLN